MSVSLVEQCGYKQQPGSRKQQQLMTEGQSEEKRRCQRVKHHLLVTQRSVSLMFSLAVDPEISAAEARSPLALRKPFL